MDKPQKEEYTALTPNDTLSVMILRRRDEALTELKEFYARYYAGSSPPAYPLVAAVSTLFTDLAAALKASLKEEEYITLRKKVYSSDAQSAINALEIINAWLYKKGLTKFDTQKKKGMY